MTRPARREEAPQYPEIYLLPVGGRHGDHSHFDFWPRRKEICVGDDPFEVAAALNDHAIPPRRS